MTNNSLNRGGILQANLVSPITHSSHNYLVKNIAPPGPSNVVRMEQVNRSNSSSRFISNGSRI